MEMPNHTFNTVYDECYRSSAAIFVAQRYEMGTDVISVHIFKHRLVNGACLIMFIMGWNFLVQVYYIPTFYQLVCGYSAMKSGLLLLPMSLTQSEMTEALILHRLTFFSPQQYSRRTYREFVRPL